MSQQYDLVVRNGFAHSRERTVDIGIVDETITDVADDLDGGGATEIDADGSLVSPSFVDCHMHLDKAFAAWGERFPKYNDKPFEYERITNLGAEYFEETPKEEIEDNAVRNARLAASNGTSHIRTHVTVDTSSGTKTAEAVIGARERVSDLVDIEIVPYSEFGYLNDDGVEEYVRESLELGADLVGGMDPLTVDDDIDDVLDIWFDIATEYGVGIDCHIHEQGSLGRYTLNRLAEKTLEHDYAGEVTVSHGYAIAGASREERDALISTFEEAGIDLVTCYTSTRPSMPVKRLMDSEIALGHGTDNDRDFVFPHGNADVLEGLLVESMKLPEDPSEGIGYRYFDSNRGLDQLWEMATTESAAVLGLEDYGIREGATANLVVFDAPSRQWAITTQATKTHVVKNGTVVAEDGELVTA